MNIETVFLRDFRNIRELSLSGFEERNVIYGQNAQGKTNLLEAIWLFTGAKSFRGAHDADFIRFGCDFCRLELSFFAEGIKHDAALEIKEKKTAFLNDNRLKTAAALAGTFHAVVFSPNDLSLIKDGPAVRRRFLDLAIGQLFPSYISLLREYLRAVTQRNQLLKAYQYDPSLSVMLEVFEGEIAEKGRKIIAFRNKYVAAINTFLPLFYEELASGKERLDMKYCCVLEEPFEETLERSRKKDMFSGSTSVGPHRDDLLFTINGTDARAFGSQGQKRSVALAVRLAEAHVVERQTGEMPVFLLDDVMSELDPDRQQYILNHIKGIQSFLTCCDPSDTAGLKDGKIFYVENGRVV